MRGEIMLSDRLNKLIRERGLSQADFLQLIKNSGVKVSQAAVSKWLGGQTKSIKAEILLPLSKALNVYPEWLQSGIGPMTPLQGENIEDATEVQKPRKRIPVISYVHAGFPNSSQTLSDEYVDADDDVSDSTYALRVKEDSMEPLFHNGDLILVDPTQAPKPGDYVIARILNEDDSTFKKLRFKEIAPNGLPVMELVPLNPDYPIYSSDTTPFELSGKIIEHRTYFKNRW